MSRIAVARWRLLKSIVAGQARFGCSRRWHGQEGKCRDAGRHGVGSWLRSRFRRQPRLTRSDPVGAPVVAFAHRFLSNRAWARCSVGMSSAEETEGAGDRLVTGTRADRARGRSKGHPEVEEN